MADDLEIVDLALLRTTELPEATRLLSARADLIDQMLHEAPSPQLRQRLQTVIDRGELIGTRLASLRSQYRAELYRAEQLRQMAARVQSFAEQE